MKPSPIEKFKQGDKVRVFGPRCHYYTKPESSYSLPPATSSKSGKVLEVRGIDVKNDLVIFTDKTAAHYRQCDAIRAPRQLYIPVKYEEDSLATRQGMEDEGNEYMLMREIL